jgi:hypothetical protein
VPASAVLAVVAAAARFCAWWRKIREVGVVDDNWKPTRFLGFVRKPNLLLAKQTFEAEADVAFWAIEEATFLRSYWDERMTKGLPRQRIGFARDAVWGLVQNWGSSGNCD